MKQIIPFKKELLFKTKVSEITSISLEHTLTLKNDDLISGEFHVSGDYKMTEGSINREKFDFKLPFEIALDSRYDMSSIIIDIDNFYYEIINNEALQVNIDVYVEGEKIEEPSLIEEKESHTPEALKEEKYDEVFSAKEPPKEIPIHNFESITETAEERTAPTIEIEEFEKEIEPSQTPVAVLEPRKDTNLTNEFNLFENMDNSDTYVTYYVYVVKEEDTIEKVITKYQTTKEEIALYNNIEDIEPGTKLIIPSNSNE